MAPPDPSASLRAGPRGRLSLSLGDVLRGQHRQGAVRTLAEAFCFEAEGVVEAGAVVFPRDCGREFDQLGLVELGAQALEERIGYFDGGVRYGVGVGEDAFFDVRK